MSTSRVAKVVVLAGGVGGARMAQGFALLRQVDLSVVVNVGDDDDFHGLNVCPDIDTVLYTLSGRVHPDQAWGVAQDTTKGLDVLKSLQSPDTWMALGDADLGLHIFRSNLLRQGATLTEVTSHIASNWGLRCAVLPASDERAATRIETPDGVVRFQEWFVRGRGAPAVRKVILDAAHQVAITPQVQSALQSAALIVVAPSNPYLSILPMLALQGMREALANVSAPVVAVSPLIQGKAVKGPLVKLMQDLGHDVHEVTIARLYQDFADGIAIDGGDGMHAQALRDASGLDVMVLPTLIAQPEKAQALAASLLAWSESKGRASP